MKREQTCLLLRRKRLRDPLLSMGVDCSHGAVRRMMADRVRQSWTGDGSDAGGPGTSWKR